MRTGLRVSDVGSPPRMRGKARTLRTGRRSRGITPAYAGKSTGGTHAHKCARDHPRVCGEKRTRGNADGGETGSPPRMRGKEACKKACEVSWGITPAYAGKRAAAAPEAAGNQDHPRVCGEKAAIAGLLPSLLGSPPRMRGKVNHFAQNCAKIGITPAYAGKSSIIPHPQGVFKDHPRVCGEKRAIPSRWTQRQGSPPRMRGKALNKEETPITDRITPAYAGKSALQRTL